MTVKKLAGLVTLYGGAILTGAAATLLVWNFLAKPFINADTAEAGARRAGDSTIVAEIGVIEVEHVTDMAILAQALDYPAGSAERTKLLGQLAGRREVEIEYWKNLGVAK